MYRLFKEHGGRDSESGSVALIFALTLTVVGGMVIAGIVLGRDTIQKREVQSAADAAALAAAYAVEQYGQPYQWDRARNIIGENTRLPTVSTFTALDRTFSLTSGVPERRFVVRVDLSATFDSEQSWFNRIFTVQSRAFAQINQAVFGQQWLSLIIVLDASKSMARDILGATGVSAYSILQQTLTAYAGHTFPVRNGLVVFRGTVENTVAPPTSDVNNFGPINSAFGAVAAPCDPSYPSSAGCAPETECGTNTDRALRAAGNAFSPGTSGRNVILISDGAPTTSGVCARCGDCLVPPSDHFTPARQSGTWVRNNVGAALFTVEIRRTPYDPANTTLLRQVSGQPGTTGNNAGMSFQVQSVLGIQAFILGLTRSICAFGPLVPGPATAPPANDPLRFRPMTPTLSDPTIQLGQPNRQRVFAYIQEGNGSTETPLRLVPDTNNAPNVMGFEYAVDPTGTESGAPGGDAWVILTVAACDFLGADGDRVVVVRWGDAELTGNP